jgi:hypothetical protein
MHSIKTEQLSTDFTIKNALLNLNQEVQPKKPLSAEISLYGHLDSE